MSKDQPKAERSNPKPNATQPAELADQDLEPVVGGAKPVGDGTVCLS